MTSNHNNDEEDEEVFFDANEDYSSTSQPKQNDDISQVQEPKQNWPCTPMYACLYFYGAPCCNLPHRFPRTFAMIFQVFIPLYSLIAIATLFGYVLCRLEAPGEMAANNMALAAEHVMDQLAGLNDIFRAVAPLICVDAYFRQLNRGELTDEEFDKFLNDKVDVLFDVEGDPLIQDLLKSETNITNMSVSNMTDMRLFTSQCGIKMNDIHREFTERTYNETNYIGDVTFNWIKCPVENFDDNVSGVEGIVYGTFTVHEPGEQLKSVKKKWEQDFQQLFDLYFAEYEQSGFDTIDSRIMAIADAYENADGFDGCLSDVMSTAWWFFTVMTTIGYGNVTPSTDGGRILVYTVGFISIILFAGILSTAGYRITCIIDDILSRSKYSSWLKTPILQMIVWGALFYSFLCVIAQVTIYWKWERVGVDMDFKDAYWFSFISSTTVGFGDYYLEHESITASDVIGFASLILVAFVLLSSFLNKLAELVKSSSETPQGKAKGSTFEEILRDTPIFSLK